MMEISQIELLLPLAVLLASCSWVEAQAFLAENDGTVLSLGYPDSLSTACQATFNQSTQCNSTVGSTAFDGLFPSNDQLALICTDECFDSLQSFRLKQSQSCSAESYPLDGQLVPATYNVDQLLFTYNYTCLQDGSTKQFCAPLIDQWSQDGPTSEQSCSECMLRTFQVELDSPFAYDDEFSTYYSSLTSSCGAFDYPITSPPPYYPSGTATTASTSAGPSTSCASEYTTKDGDSCLSVSKAQGVSTAMLRYQNGISADCSNFPKVGTSLCMPAPCELYTLQANETCYGISQAHNFTFTVTQMVSWNPDINRDCSNLNAIVGSELCISAPGDTGEPDSTSIVSTTEVSTPAPSNVVDGTNARCAKYYEVVPGDTCSSVTVMMSISLSDFFFLNPEVNNPNCTNLLKGYSYCVEAVGNIATYSGYGGNRNPCVMTVPIPSSCLATGAVTTDTVWTFPTYSTNTTLPTALTLAPGTLSNCSTYTQYYAPLRNTSTVNTCYVVASLYDENVDDFVSWNPSLSYDPDHAGECQLKQGYQYCAQLVAPTTTPTVTSVTSTTSIQQTTSTGLNGEPTPLPIQTGMNINCERFDLVQANDSCYDIAAGNNIALQDFYLWNPAIKNDCSGLYPHYYVCVRLLSSGTTTTKPTSAGGDQTSTLTPMPTQSGMVGDCTKFYLAQSNDNCYDIASVEGIPTADLYSWNPALNGDCSGLWPDYYYCVGRAASSTTSTTATKATTTTTAANSTPTPTQSGMVAGCKSFYLVKSGDGCYDIAISHGITTDEFYSYNPTVGNDCGGLWPDYYVCVGKIMQ